MLYLIIFFLLFIIFYKFKEKFVSTPPISIYNEYILTDNDNNNKYYLVPLSILDNNIKLYLLDNNLISETYNKPEKLKTGIINNIDINMKPLNDILYAININDIHLFFSNNNKLLFDSNNKPILYDNKNYNIIENSDMYILNSNISISNYTYPFNKSLLNNKLDIDKLNDYSFELNQINIDNTKKIYEVKLSFINTNIKLIKGEI